MITLVEEFVRLRTSSDPDEYRRAVMEEAPEELWLEIIRTEPDMAVWVVLNKTVPATVLEVLSRSADDNVRAQVGRTRRAPHHVLRELARDRDESTRMAVAVNPKTPADILHTLCSDEWEDVAAAAKQRLATREK